VTYLELNRALDGHVQTIFCKPSDEQWRCLKKLGGSWRRRLQSVKALALCLTKTVMTHLPPPNESNLRFAFIMISISEEKKRLHLVINQCCFTGTWAEAHVAVEKRVVQVCFGSELHLYLPLHYIDLLL